jgi:hypothetical protein
VDIKATADTADRPRFPERSIIGMLDRPAGYVLAPCKFTVSGWALGSVELSAIEICIDGTPVGDAAFGLDRPDVATIFRGHHAAAASGFVLRGLAVPALAEVITVSAVIKTAEGHRKELAVAVPVFRSAAVALAFLDRQPAPGLQSYVELAASLVDASRFEEAEQVVDAMRRRFPDVPARYVEEARYLIRRDRLDEAEILLTLGSERFPDHAQVNATFAVVAERRQDWPAAILRWRLVRERFSNYSGRGERQAHDPSWDAARQHYANLVLKFESLGASCDFGLVQRHYDSEPVGLLRFSGAPLPQLLTALQNGFAGVGKRANTRFDPRAESNGTIEYWLCDDQYKFEMHTHLFHDQSMTPGRLAMLLPLYCQRLALLRNALIDDLKKPKKIFVYQRAERLSHDEVMSLFRAIRTYGPGVLLCGLPEDDAHSAGTVEQLEDGLLLGYLDRFIGPENPDPAYDTWLKICLAADEIVRSSA